MLIHLDTDLGGDTDDACALAMLLGRPEVELAGVTTVHDPSGRRAGYVHRLLAMADRSDVPVAAGTSPSLTTGTVPGGFPDEDRYWGQAVPARPGGDAPALVRANAARGATIVAIGPFTNLALAASSLGRTTVVLMGGWTGLPRPGLPQWGPDMDWNVTCDPEAANVVAGAAGALTVAPLGATMDAQLRRPHLARLRAAGPIGALLARQATAHAEEHDQPGDLLNFQYDSVACAAALGWPGIRVVDATMASVVDIEGDRPIRLVDHVDSEGFAEAWLAAIEHIPH